MGDPVATNILKSNATVWYAPAGEALPDETSVAAGGDWGGNWERIGYTAAPLIWTLTDERAVIEVQEERIALDEYGTRFESMLATELSELTADYLALLMGGTVSTTSAGASQKGYEQLDIDPGFILTKYIIGFEGVRQIADGSNQPLRVFAEKSTFKINGDVEFDSKSDTYTRLPIMLRVLKGTNYALRFQRVTAAAMS